MKTITLLVALTTVTTGLCGELVVKGNEELGGINLWLESLDNAEAEPRLPDNHVGSDGDDKNPYRWNNVKPGKYIVRLDPDYEDSPMIAWVPVTVGDVLTTINVVVPSGLLDVIVKFDGITEPNQRYEGDLLFRVELVDSSGRTDPYVRHWLWTEKKEDKSIGSLNYLKPGIYRVIALSIDERAEKKDVASGELKVDEAILKTGSATVIINKKVEQAAPGS